MAAKLPVILLALAAGAAVQAAAIDTVPVERQGAGGYPVLAEVEAIRGATLAAQVAGRVEAVAVEGGAQVQAGQWLVRIDAAAADAGAAAARAGVAAAEAELARVRAEQARARQLRAADYISEAAMQRADAALKVAEESARSRRAELAAASAQSRWHLIRAPYAGHVTSLQVAVGDLATPGRPLLTIYDPGELRAVAEVPEAVAATLRAGQPAVATTLDGKPVATRGWQRMAAIDPATRSVSIRVDLARGAALLPGEQLQLLLPAAGDPTALRVPASAILRRGELVAVYVIDAEGKPHLRQVRPGRAIGGFVPVLAGLEAGERVARNAATVVVP